MSLFLGWQLRLNAFDEEVGLHACLTDERAALSDTVNRVFRRSDLPSVWWSDLLGFPLRDFFLRESAAQWYANGAEHLLYRFGKALVRVYRTPYYGSTDSVARYESIQLQRAFGISDLRLTAQLHRLYTNDQRVTHMAQELCKHYDVKLVMLDYPMTQAELRIED